MSTAAPATALPAPPYPEEAVERQLQGRVVVSVSFNSDGRVDSCRIVQSSGQDVLDHSTVRFIKRYWVAAAKAGQTLTLPIDYKLTPAMRQVADRFGKTTLEQLLAAQGFTHVPVDEPAGRINATELEVRLNDHPVRLIVDTGSAFSVISSETARRSHVALDNKMHFPMRAINGMVGITGLAMPTNFQIGGRGARPINIFVCDTTADLENGVIGLSTLKANHAVILVNPPAIFINPDHAANLDLKDWLLARGSVPVPLEYLDYAFQMPIKLDGFPASVTLDTGAALSLINRQFIAKNNFFRANIGLPLSGVDGSSVESDIVRFGEIDLGEFPLGRGAMTTATASYFGNGKSKTDALLGFDILGSIATVIDTSSNTVYFRKLPPRPL